MQHGLSPRVAKGHFALHPPWELLPQGEFEEGGGLECGYKDGDQLESQGHHQWVCESRVGTNGGRGPRRGGEGPGVVSFSHVLISWPIL